MLVVQVAKEINELRYVLCPKRMTDAQFWQIYFQLAKEYLPAEAFDASFVPPKSSTQALTFADLQVPPFTHALPHKLHDGMSSVVPRLGLC